MINSKVDPATTASIVESGPHRDDGAETPMIIVGGTGGSGTRAVAHYLSMAGVFMGSRLNRSMDSLPFAVVLDQYTDQWLAFRDDEARGFDREGFVSLWRDRAREHLAGHNPLELWGTKNPRTILILELLYQSFAQMRFLHVIRDGLEMAYSSNQRQLTIHGEGILGPAMPGETPPERSLRLWAVVNDQARQLGKRQPGRYACVRYEDFCVNPVGEMQRIARQLSLHLQHQNIRRSDYLRSTRRIAPDDAATILPLNPSVAGTRSRFGYPAL